MQDKVIFYSKDLQSSRLPNDLPSLGLLQAVQGLTLTNKSLSYNFLHLSIQELLAAYHISQMASSEQIKVFKELFESSRFQAVLLYYCGFTKLNNPAIQEFISFYQHDISSLKKILPLLHCFYETQQPSLCQLIDTEFSTNMILKFSEIHNPSDYIAIGYFITSLLSMPCHSANVPPVHLSVVGINDYYLLKLLLTELSKYPVEELPTAGNFSRKLVFTVQQTTDDGIYKFRSSGPSITAGPVVKLIASHLELSPAISELRIANGAIQSDQEDGLLHIATALQTNSSLTKLSLLNMRDVRYTEKNISALVKMLQVNKSLQYLDLSQNRAWSVESVRIFHHFVAGLQHSTTLTHLILRNSRFPCYDSETARSFTEMLQVNKSLTHLDLSENSFIDSGSHCVFEGLQHNNTLVNLNLSTTGLRSTDSDTVRSLSKMLQVNKSLTHLDLSGNFLLLKGCCVFDGLRHNSTLTHLSLSNNDWQYLYISPDISRSLSQMLQVNQSLTHLDLSNTRFFSMSEGLNIFKSLQHNTTLVNLNLSNTGIHVAAADPDTARSLTKMLQVNKSLTHLDLSKNDPNVYTDTNSIISHTFQGLKHNTTLLHLNISHITMTDSDMECATQALPFCSLETLDLSFTYNSTSHILDSLELNSSLKVLYLSRQYGETEDIIKCFKIARQDNGLPPIQIKFR